MALDPILKAFLDQMAAQAGPKMHSLSPQDARAAFAALLNAVGPRDVPIGKVANLNCAGIHGAIPLRAYTPVAAADERLPTLVFFHGGGFMVGDLDTHDGLCRILANQACVRVIAVDYRLAPEHKYPAAVEDAYAALTFVEAHASELGVDANRLAVGGDSAGGNLAAVLTQMAKEQGGPRIAFQMLLFPVTQIGSETNSLCDYAEGYLLERATLDWWYNEYLAEGANMGDPRISPLAAASFAGLPPACLMTAEFDPLRDEGLRYAECLRRDGVDVRIADHAGLVHDFIYLHSVLPQAADALNDAAASVRDALKAG
jgi:acetyl esterase